MNAPQREQETTRLPLRSGVVSITERDERASEGQAAAAAPAQAVTRQNTPLDEVPSIIVDTEQPAQSPVQRANTPVPDVPSIIVDDGLAMNTAVHARPRFRRRGRFNAKVAAGWFAGGLLASSLLMSTRDSTPEAAPVPPPLPVAAAEPVVAASPATTRAVLQLQPLVAEPEVLTPGAAIRRVDSAMTAMRMNNVRQARHLLTSVLAQRPGHPGALAGMTQLELDAGNLKLATHYARRAVRAQPSSALHWQLLSEAAAGAGLQTESDRAGRRAAALAK